MGFFKPTFLEDSMALYTTLYRVGLLMGAISILYYMNEPASINPTHLLKKPESLSPCTPKASLCGACLLPNLEKASGDTNITQSHTSMHP